MLGARQGLTAQVNEANRQVIILHCLLHWENLVSQRLSPKLKVVMQEVIQVVNFIKLRSLNYRIFIYCITPRCGGCREERCFNEWWHCTQVKIFLLEKNHPLATRILRFEVDAASGYHADIFAEKYVCKYTYGMCARAHVWLSLGHLTTRIRVFVTLSFVCIFTSLGLYCTWVSICW